MKQLNSAKQAGQLILKWTMNTLVVFAALWVIISAYCTFMYLRVVLPQIAEAVQMKNVRVEIIKSNVVSPVKE